jgi:prepilin peptidase CpaA
MMLSNAILLIAGIAACFDLCTAKIPNAVLLSALAGGAALRLTALCRLGVPAFGSVLREGARGLCGLLIPMLLLLPVWHFRMIGAGDIKLLSVIGFLAGWRGSLWITFWSFAVAAVFSVGIMYRHHSAKKRLYYFLNYLRKVSRNEKTEPYREAGGGVAADSEMHFSVAVLITAMMYAAGLAS